MIPTELTSEKEMIWLGEQAAKHLCIAEVGTYLGRTTRVMAKRTMGTVYAVDTWNPESLPANEHYLEFREKPKGWFFNEFCRNVADLLANGKVRPVQLASVDAAKIMESLSFDMVFIDAAHDYENVKADIEAWKPLLAPGGLLCGHDFEPHRGVPQAVRELVPDFQLGPGLLWWANA